jgi:hypothetical protein
VQARAERCGAAKLFAAMELAQAQGAFGAAYLGALVSAPVPEPPPPAPWLVLPDDVPSQLSACDGARSSRALPTRAFASNGRHRLLKHFLRKVCRDIFVVLKLRTQCCLPGPPTIATAQRAS